MKLSSQNGFSLIGVFAVAALLLTLALYRGWHGMKILRQRADYVHALHAESRATESALQSALIGSVPELPQALNCSNHSEHNADISIIRRVCQRFDQGTQVLATQALIEGSALPKKILFPQFDFNATFRKLTPCSYSKIVSTKISASGFALSPRSAISKIDCKSLAFSDSMQNAYAGNLAIDSDVTAPNTLRTIAAKGYVDVAASLGINSDIIVLAGGDLHLKNLSALTAVRVALVSATGIVMLDEISGPISLRVIAWQGAFLPSNAQLLPHDNLPPRLAQEILSLTASSPP